MSYVSKINEKKNHNAMKTMSKVALSGKKRRQIDLLKNCFVYISTKSSYQSNFSKMDWNRIESIDNHLLIFSLMFLKIIVLCNHMKNKPCK